MFGKLKEKLNGALSIFSKRTEEEAIELPAEKKEKIILEQQNEKIIVEQKKDIQKHTPTKQKETLPKEKKKEEKKETSKKVELKKEEKLVPAEAVEKIDQNIIKITYFVHGTTTDNEQGKCTGWAPGELSELGKKQSKELWSKIQPQHFDVVICSDLKRAVDSANLTFKGKVEIIQDQRLRECNYGDFNQKEEVKVDYLKHIEKPFQNGESLQDVERRLGEFLNHLYESYKGKHVAIVAHRAPQLALEVILNHKSWTQALADDWRNTKAWQPGWIYILKSKIKLKPLPQEQPTEKKSFFGKIRETFTKKEEPKEEPIKEVKPLAKETEEKEGGFFSKVKQSITTRSISTEKFEELFWDLELALLENNVSVEVIEKIKEDLKKELVDKPLPWDLAAKIELTLKTTLENILSQQPINLLEEIKKKQKKPYIIAFYGINGAGKTTSIAKLAHYLQQQKLSIVFAACDTFRAAAIQQLEEHANNLNIKIIKHDYGSDAAAVAFDAIKFAEKNQNDVVLIDTAGRLHSNTNLMAELKKLITKNKPDLNIFVGESITGNDCIEQARSFNDLVPLDGVILTKADVDEKGGAPLSISYTIKKPILFLGTGQKYSDLEPFDANVILKQLGF
ncbi:TPA: signal recognition particle-docking protein FtsY [Candidatus Woesearchaeota archaeon]|nr:signal recognition particle-docking protein FtsY [Candidatus Woesearchaeota archaeon]